MADNFEKLILQIEAGGDDAVALFKELVKQMRALEKANDKLTASEAKALDKLKEKVSLQKEAIRIKRAEAQAAKKAARAERDALAQEIRARRRATRIAQQGFQDRLNATRATALEESNQAKKRIRAEREVARVVKETSRQKRASVRETARVEREARASAARALEGQLGIQARRRAAFLRQQRNEAKEATNAEKVRQKRIRRELQILQGRRRAIAAQRRADSRASVKADRAAARATRLKAQADRDAARATARRARAEKKTNNAIRTQVLLQRELGFTIRQLTRQFILLVTVVAGFRAIRGFLRAGIEFNRVIESASLGIAALISAQTTLVDEQGIQIKGAEALAGAYKLAADQVEKLRINGIQTAATTQQLVEAFQQAVGAGLRVGLTLDEIRIFTVRAVQASAALGVKMNQINQEVRSILDGTIDRNSRVAKALLLTNQQIKQARLQNRLADLLNEKFEAFEAAGIRSLTTFTVLVSNIKEAFEVFAGESVQPLFNEFRDEAFTALEGLFDFDTARFSKEIEGLFIGLRPVFREIGLAVGDGIRATVAQAQRLSDIFKENKQELLDIASAGGEVFRSMVSLVATAVGLPAAATESAAQFRLLIPILNLISSIFNVIRDNLTVIVGLITGLLTVKIIASIIAGGPIGIAIAAVFALAVAIDFVVKARKRAAVAAARQVRRLGDESEEIIRLAGTYRDLQLQISSGALVGSALELALNRQKVILEALRDLIPEVSELLDDQTLSADELAEALRRLAQARGIEAALQLIIAEENLTASQAEKRALEDQIGELKQKRTAIPDQFEGTAVSFVGREELDQAKRDLRRVTEELEIQQELVESLRANFQQINRALKDTEATGLIVPGDPSQLTEEEIAKNLLKRREGELRLAKAIRAEELASISILFRERSISAETFFRKQLALNESVIDAEIALRQARVGAASEVTRAGVAERSALEVEAFERQRLQVRLESNDRIFLSDKQLAEQQEQLASDLLAFTGDKVGAQEAKLRFQFRDLLKRAIIENNDDLQAQIEAFIARTLVGAQFAALEERVASIRNALRDELLRINTEAETGITSTIEQRNQIANANERAANATALLVEQMELLLPLLRDDPKFAEKVRELVTQFDNMRRSIALTRDILAQFGQGAVQVLEDEIANGLTDLILLNDTVANSFAKMARSIIASLQRIISQLLAQLAVQQLVNAFSGGFSAGGSVDIIGTVKPQFAAAGGFITGPGTATSDSIPARLSHGEYVVKASAVSALGIRFMDMLNSMNSVSPRRRHLGNRFAEGGIVTPRGGTIDGTEISLGISLEPGLILDVLGSPEGIRTQVRTVERNPRQFRGALGNK